MGDQRPPSQPCQSWQRREDDGEEDNDQERRNPRNYLWREVTTHEGKQPPRVRSSPSLPFMAKRERWQTLSFIPIYGGQRGLLELAFDDTFVKPYMELYFKPIQEFYMIKTSQRELIMMCTVIVDSMLKVLKRTHTS